MNKKSIIHNYLPYIDPFATEEDLLDVKMLNDYEIYFSFKDGRRFVYDTVLRGSRGFYPEGHELTDAEWKTSFKTRLYKLMTHRGVTQAELADKIGTSQTMVSHYITGRSVPGVVAAAKIARVLGCSIEDLLYKDC
jgi:DNA-binding XRE family transcriptional regulator